MEDEKDYKWYLIVIVIVFALLIFFLLFNNIISRKTLKDSLGENNKVDPGVEEKNDNVIEVIPSVIDDDIIEPDDNTDNQDVREEPVDNTDVVVNVDDDTPSNTTNNNNTATNTNTNSNSNNNSNGSNSTNNNTTVEEKKYVVKFVYGDNTVSQNFVYGTEQALKQNTFTKEGYSFGHWNTKEDGSGTSYNDGQSVKNLTSTNNGVVNLYPIWNENSYTVSFDANGGTGTI